MKSQFHYLISFSWLAFVVSHAAISPEVYWKVKLPNTLMPKVIKDFLPHTDHNFNGNIVPWHHAATEEEIHELKVNRGKIGSGMLHWYCAATEEEIRELKDDNNNFIYKPFFFENDLTKGNIINFPSLKHKNDAPFLPRQSTIPFSSKKFTEILNHFSIDSNSNDAQIIKETIYLCEEPDLHKEKKFCATSLESMVDFMLSELGTNNIEAITTEVEGESSQIIQRYTMEKVEEIADGNNMVCHKINYPYAVHYCHVGGRTKTFMVSMIGVDGTKVKALSVCHQDTSFWNPKGIPFVMFNVKPGTTPFCHFLPSDQIVIFPSKEATN
ncbi:BURP domain-containing protein 6-like [Solanum lycopersicum]|uniref:BURP domain-containing protein n=1 Tax=Solanum lycopersicum TaxID=4081 RepID=A0A3Q7FJE7_SOLLC|nr:BURP domain-containing protein 5-like [Solanum lycopersicum]